MVKLIHIQGALRMEKMQMALRMDAHGVSYECKGRFVWMHMVFRMNAKGDLHGGIPRSVSHGGTPRSFCMDGIHRMLRMKGGRCQAGF